MRAAGRAGDPNFNTLEASALLDTALVPYHDLFSGDRHYTRIITNMGEGEDKVTMSRIISEEVDRTLSRWKNFDFQMQQMQRDFVAFGRGYLAWDNEASWRFRKVAQHRVMVPDSSEIDSRSSSRAHSSSSTSGQSRPSGAWSATRPMPARWVGTSTR
jgi:hypothetical protein